MRQKDVFYVPHSLPFRGYRESLLSVCSHQRLGWHLMEWLGLANLYDKHPSNKGERRNLIFIPKWSNTGGGWWVCRWSLIMGTTGIVSLVISDVPTLRRFLSYPGDPSEEDLSICLRAFWVIYKVTAQLLIHEYFLLSYLSSSSCSSSLSLSWVIQKLMTTITQNNFTDHIEDEFHLPNLW